MIAGFLLGHGVTGALKFDARSGFVADLATVALIVILFRDGLEVEGEMLQVALASAVSQARAGDAADRGDRSRSPRGLLVGLGWTESFLLGALLSPTDPVLSSSVVTNPRVPRLIRHSLDLESGLNDGLALPGGAGARRRRCRPASPALCGGSFALENIGFGLLRRR